MDSGQITKENLVQALQEVSQQNNRPITQAQATALSNKVYSGESTMNRVQLKEAILKNAEIVQVISTESVAATNPIVEKVMVILDESKSGTIQKKEFQRALAEVADNNEMNLDVNALVELVYDRNPSLSR